MTPLVPLIAALLAFAPALPPIDDDGDEPIAIERRDVDGDGVEEVLRVLAAPGSAGTTRVELWRASSAGTFTRIFTAGPSVGLTAHFDGDALLCLEQARGATSSETRRFKMKQGALTLDRVIPATPTTPADRLAWSLEWARRGDYQPARAELVLLTPTLTGPARTRAALTLARIQLIQSDPTAAAATLSTSQAGGPYADDAARLTASIAAWVPATSAGPAPLALLAAAQLDLEAGRLDRAGERARRALSLSPAGAPWIDDALLAEAQSHLESGRSDRAVAALVELVERCPASPHRDLALSWIASESHR